MRRPTRILTLAGAVPLTLLALASCTQPTSLPAIPTGSATATATPSPTPTHGPAAATIAGLARREAGQGTVVAVQDEADGTEWDVRLVLRDGTVQELHLANDGTVLAGPSEDATDPNEQSRNRAQVAAAAVGLADAEQRMLAAVPGGSVTSIALDDYQQGVVWQGDVLAEGVRHDVRIDAVNGAVVLNKADAPATPPAGS